MAASKVVLIVSNSSSEIVEHLAEELLKAGQKVVKVCCRTDVSSEKGSRSILANESMPLGNCLELRVDFENEGQVDKIIPAVLSEFGQIDVLINNLCHDYRASSLLETNSLNEFNRALQVDLYIPARVAQSAAAHLKLSPSGGVIINIAPGTGQSVPQNMFRDIIKAGLMMLTKTLANALEGHNVRCLSIVSSLDRIHAPAEATNYLTTKISELIKFLISGESDYVNATIIEVNSV